jgi:hypothetical protein
MARSRAGVDFRPACCRAAGPEEHTPERARKYDLDPSAILGDLDGATAGQRAAAQFSDAIGSGLRVGAAWNAISPTLAWNSERCAVIGQDDLTEDWRQVSTDWRAQFGENVRVVHRGPQRIPLVPRGDYWPWAELLEENRRGASLPRSEHELVTVAE